MNIRILLIGATLFSSTYLVAQNPQISLGADVGIPFGDMSKDGASLILGPTLGFEVPVGRVAFTLQGGYSLVFVKENERTGRPATRGWNMIPAQLGLKYFFTEPQLGWYAHGQAGIHSMIRDFGEVQYEIVVDADTAGGTSPEPTPITFPTLGITSTLFSYGLGIGYQSERLDVSLRYQGIGADEEQTVFVQVPDGGGAQESITYPTAAAYSYIGIRIAYLFNLGANRSVGTTTP